MAKSNPRAKRLGEQIQRELTDLLRRDVKDERVGNVTITAVNVSGDLRTARVYYLVFGKEGADPKVQQGLTSAAGFLRNALSKALMIRYTPTLTFELDTTIEHGVRLTQLIDSLKKPEGSAVGTAAVGMATAGTAAVGMATAGTAGAATPAAASDAGTDEHDHIVDEG